jgi:hypothetical protein
MAIAHQPEKSTPPNRDGKKKSNEGSYQPVEQASDEEIAQTQRRLKQPSNVEANTPSAVDDEDEEVNATLDRLAGNTRHRELPKSSSHRP